MPWKNIARKISGASRLSLLVASALVFLVACWFWQRSHAWHGIPHLIYVKSPSHPWLKVQIYPGTLQISIHGRREHERWLDEGWVWVRRPAGQDLGGRRIGGHRPAVGSDGRPEHGFLK
jgi:hypothetical protein